MRAEKTDRSRTGQQWSEQPQPPKRTVDTIVASSVARANRPVRDAAAAVNDRLGPVSTGIAGIVLVSAAGAELVLNCIGAPCSLASMAAELGAQLGVTHGVECSMGVAAALGVVFGGNLWGASGLLEGNILAM